MKQPVTDHQSELETSANDYLNRIRQIDAILERPAMTLIKVATDGKRTKREFSELPTDRLVAFPALIADVGEFVRTNTLLTQSLCCVTLQRLWRLRRRFTWLDDKPKFRAKETLGDLQKYLGGSYVPENPERFESYLELLRSDTFGWLNPFTASQVANVLLDSEDSAHRGMGFLTFFVMVWSLYRRFPDQMRVGARIEPWEPTAYVTGKCLLTLKTLQSIVERRARLYERVSQNLDELNKHSKDDSHKRRWQFRAELDDLASNLELLERYSITDGEFSKSAKKVEGLSEGKHTCETTCKTNKLAELDRKGNPLKRDERDFNCTLDYLKNALAGVGRASQNVLTEAGYVVEGIETTILKRLNSIEGWKEGAPPAELEELKRFGLRFPIEYNDDHKYWEDVRDAAQKSLERTRLVLDQVKEATLFCNELAKYQYKADGIGPTNHTGNRQESESPQESLLAEIQETIAKLVQSNFSTADLISDSLSDATRWCCAVVDREIAHATAGNVTDFEPSELVNAIAVAVRCDLNTTESQVAAAARSALQGAREDGSWKAGRPFYSPDDVQGVWTTTSDSIWTLTSAIGHYPDVREADEALFRYVDWLENRCVTLRRPEPADQKGTNSRASSARSPKKFEYVGWPGERLRHRRKIHLATTAYSINALLDIRDLVEYRLWQLCKTRFTVVNVDKSLKQVDPVGLGLKHGHRLHTQLARMATDAQEPENKDACYSLVLHGPPGSSKTSIAEGLSSEMWKASSNWGERGPRLLRITPADFTRLGEDRIDSEARLIFNLIGGIRGATILFDEIDDLLRERDPKNLRPRFIDLVVPAMLNRLADLRTGCPRQETCFLIATNFIERIEPALIRKGRVDASIAVVYPDFESRLAMIDRELPDAARTFDRRKFAEETAQWPYPTIKTTLQAIAKEHNTQPPGTEDGDLQTIVDSAILQHESSFSKPSYEHRWHSVKRFCQELFNEHVEHILSASKTFNVNIFEDEGTMERIVKLLARIDPDDKHKKLNTKQKEEAMKRLLKMVAIVQSRREVQ